MESLSPTLEDVLDEKATAEQSVLAALNQLYELTGLSPSAVILRQANTLGARQQRVVGVEIKLEL